MEHLFPNDIEHAATLIRNGALVAFPTETVYGLGARADDDCAVASIFEAKGRPSFNPLIVHVANLEAALEVAKLSPEMLRLADAFWPGALTLVAPVKGKVSKLVTAGLGTVAVRVPDHPVAQDLLFKAQLPIAAPSANPSGRLSPTSADHVIAGLGGKIAAVLDGGPTGIGLESTILGDRGNTLSILRPGGISRAAIEAKLGRHISEDRTTDNDTPDAPGQLSSHYAPALSIRRNAREIRTGEIYLGFGENDLSAHNLSRDGDLAEAAANLFEMLHKLDQIAVSSDIRALAVAPIPEKGIGIAINDRLRRAAAPR